ncbi:30S ribosomal protein S5 [bacterium]|nr:30S ribosomal protein S5 [bacterium]
MFKNQNTRRNQEFDEEVLEIRRVTKVTEGGKNLRFRAALVLGDRKGQIGFGVAKALEVPKALEKARLQAKKNMIKLPLVEDTIPFEVEVDYKQTRVFLKPASPGTGLIVGRLIRPLLELAGVRNVLSKVKGSKNKIANAWAVMEAYKKIIEYHRKIKQSKKEAKK